MSILKNQRVLITGGTGSFGQEFLRYALASECSNVIIFSRDELKQHELRQSLSPAELEKVRFFLGDCRDVSRLESAFYNVDIVVHAAALKHVASGEYNPSEVINTNIMGTLNVFSAALSCGVKKLVALSTDKASSPVNLYGASKLVGDKFLAAAANSYFNRGIEVSIVRYGNVIGSRGSIIPGLLKRKERGELEVPITDLTMSRFLISLVDGVKLVELALTEGGVGEIFIPKIPSVFLETLIDAIYPEARINVIGAQPGEKYHEELLSREEARMALDLGDHYRLFSGGWASVQEMERLLRSGEASVLPAGFEYISNANHQVFNREELLEFLRQHEVSSANDV